MTINRYNDPKNITSILEFVEAIGIKVSVDWDGQVVVAAPHPDEINERALSHALKRSGFQLSRDAEARRARGMRRCMGGPKHGEKHGWGVWSKSYYRERRGLWHVYHVHADGRAVYAGRASSEAQARKLRNLAKRSSKKAEL